MQYELAKQLKEAGFPQKVNVGTFYWDDLYQAWRISALASEINLETVMIRPTLSELIEACRVGQYGAFVLFENKERNEWAAEIMNSIPTGPTPYKESLDVKVYGNTPEEAVVKLWLELNKYNETNNTKS